LPPGHMNIPSLNNLSGHSQHDNMLSLPNTFPPMDTPKGLFPSDMPFTPLTPGTSAIIDNIMSSARHSSHAQNQQTNLSQQTSMMSGMMAPNNGGGNNAQMFGGQSQSGFPQQSFNGGQMNPMMQSFQSLPPMNDLHTSAAVQAYQNSGKRRSIDAGLNRDEDSPSSKKRKAGPVLGLSIRVPDGGQIPMRRVEDDSQQPASSQMITDEDETQINTNELQVPQHIQGTMSDNNKNDDKPVAGNSSEMTPMGALFSPTPNDNSTTPLQLATPTSFSTIDWPSPTSALKKDIISS